MRHPRGFSLTEMVLVVALMALAVGLVLVGGRRGSAARALDGTAREVEAALRYARQAAPNHAAGARVDFTAPSASQEGSWSVVVGSKVEKQGVLPRDLTLTLNPSGTQVQFVASGSPDAARTVTLTSATTNQSRQIQVHAVTGAVERVGP